MADLKDAIPTDEFHSRFREISETVYATNMGQMARNCPEKMMGISLFIWDEAVHRGLVKQEFKIGPYTKKPKAIYPFVRSELKFEPVSAAISVSYFNERNPKVSFADVTLVQCYPEDIHIVDVEFSDNSQPLRDADPTREYRNYRGLHVFGTFLDRLLDVARKRDAKRLSLMCAYPPLYEVWKKYGFVMSETKMAKAAYAHNQRGFPMVRMVDV
ncbi:hypothetical protein J2X76_001426 [Neorhizobium sp. 2083]|uniref:hypothetical protein n=1 Tax=Neorhizobium sp. 2083 TaxID=2817762 RepID=UPI00285630B0|nr:hypothetical protein [Neorhizobium sp. 2083]MDR6816272.1 hypothetical protein [Neorhizobium sp. 2083]